MPYDLLFFLAHPDDESFLCAGTVARLAAEGRRSGLVCCTRGQQGAVGDPPLATRATVAQVREAELRAACAAVDLDVLAVLDYEDKHLAEADPEEVRRAFVRHLRAARPTVVGTFDPNGFNNHPDHVAVSRFTLDAVALAADARWSPDLGPAHRVRRVVWSPLQDPSVEWRPERLAERGGVDYVVDTSGEPARRKKAALAAHRTQQASVRRVWYDDPARTGAGVRVFDVETFRHGWGEPPPAVPAVDLFAGLGA